MLNKNQFDMPTIAGVSPLGGYKLLIDWSDDTQTIYDASGYMNRERTALYSSPETFEKVQADPHYIYWGDEDYIIMAEDIYEDSFPYSQVTSSSSSKQNTFLSMAKVKEQNVPLKLADMITNPAINIDPWWSNKDHWNNKKWAKEFNVYGIRFFLLFKAPFDLESQAELQRSVYDNANFEFCGICVFFSDTGNFYTAAPSDFNETITKIDTEIKQDTSEADVVKLFGLKKNSVKNPLNYID